MTFVVVGVPMTAAAIWMAVAAQETRARELDTIGPAKDIVVRVG